MVVEHDKVRLQNLFLLYDFLFHGGSTITKTSLLVTQNSYPLKVTILQKKKKSHPLFEMNECSKSLLYPLSPLEKMMNGCSKCKGFRVGAGGSSVLELDSRFSAQRIYASRVR